MAIIHERNTKGYSEQIKEIVISTGDNSDLKQYLC